MKPPMDPELRSRLISDGARLLAGGGYFEAHEAFEDLWNGTSHSGEREIWQGLSQLAAALVKHQRGEPATAISLFAKARSRLKGAPLEPQAAESLRAWLDTLVGPIAGEHDLPDTTLPLPFLEAVRSR